MCRLEYKRLAVLSEYFNVYETKFLNGPALNRVEEGSPDSIIPPQGFQAMEEFFSTMARAVTMHSSFTWRTKCFLY
jgi:hypothetical protein